MNNESQDEKNPVPEEQEAAVSNEQEAATPEEEQQAAPEESAPAAAKMSLEDIEGPEDAIAWLKENAMPMLVGLLIAALAFLGVSYFKHQKKAEAMTAESMLFNSQAASQFTEITTKYPGAPAAPLAELSLASQQFEDGQYDLARNSFATFVQKHPDHSFTAAAVLGQAQCDEAQFKFGDALKGYENFIKSETNSFLFAQAVFGKGRCLEQMGRFDDARAVYEDYIAAHPKDPWTARAETALMYVGKAKRAAQHPAAPAQVTLPPLSSAPTATPLHLNAAAPIQATPAAPAPATPAAPAPTKK